MKEILYIEDVARQEVYMALQGVIDPEVGINIVDLGLIYDFSFNYEKVEVTMSMTTPACPMSNYLLEEAKKAVQAKLHSSIAVDIKLVWEPPWDPQMMTDKAKQILGWK